MDGGSSPHFRVVINNPVVKRFSFISRSAFAAIISGVIVGSWTSLSIVLFFPIPHFFNSARFDSDKFSAAAVAGKISAFTSTTAVSLVVKIDGSTYGLCD
jgi:hypothetical protein